MPEYLPSSRSATLTVVAVSSRLVKVEAPETAEAGEEITVKVTVANTSNAYQFMWAKVRDMDTGETVAYKDTIWLAPHAEYTFEWKLTMPGRDWHLEIRAGHKVGETYYEGEGSPKYATVRLRTAPPAPPAPPELLPQLLAGTAPLFAAGAVVAYSETRKRGR